MGDASQTDDFHSKEWTQVRNKKCKDDKTISKLLGSWKVVEDTKWTRKLKIAPEMFVYLLKPVNTFNHS
jgi:hypothetical protein